MKESVTYMAILEEGEIREARRMVLRAATNRLGPATVEAVATIEAIESVERLETLRDRVFQVETWDELLVLH